MTTNKEEKGYDLETSGLLEEKGYDLETSGLLFLSLFCNASKNT